MSEGRREGPLRVLQLMSCRGWSSDAWAAVSLTLGLQERGHEVILVCREKEGEGVAEKAAEAGVRRIEFLSFQSGLRPAVWRRDIRGLRRLMGAADIQVLHAHRGQDHWLAAATLRLGGGGRGGGKKEIGRPPRSSAPGTSSNPSGRIRPTAGSITGPRTGWSRRPKKSGRGLSARARSGPHGSSPCGAASTRAIFAPA